MGWIMPPIERSLAMVCHVTCRSMVLLGHRKGDKAMKWYGYTLFALLDGIAGGFHYTGQMNNISMWWVQLAISPIAAAAGYWMKHCWKTYPQKKEL
eukprot:NODE_4304_length_352_cov_498.821782_g3705_i0.p1 GENE.NODE_4304_length_352_cov_498.821782_g3705_i0~~NODE_4304_length_352_cov_498.821782_g3705_i0.p1  ORF type:complete len:106 (+),score=21.45 NODE_4304_length_352_cov_498.821782_g3705_i0:31-318(+)